MNWYNYIEVRQPIGPFYICSIPVKILMGIVDVSIDKEDNRDKKSDRAAEVVEFCLDYDTILTTPIVVRVNDDADLKIDEEKKMVGFVDGNIVGEVIDGQHRLRGVKHPFQINDFELPVILMFNMTLDEKTYVFSSINNNQQKDPERLIDNQSGVCEKRSPQKTIHQIARVMNSNVKSPFCNRLKMLGKFTSNQADLPLSQGTFVKSILKLITRNPDIDLAVLKDEGKLKGDDRCPLRQFFIDKRDDVIAKVIFNCFNALRTVFNEEWNNPDDNILWKTTGFNAIIYAFPLF